MTAGPELSIIIPTFNERENVPVLIERLGQALGALRWEAVFVDDDSPDGTAAYLRDMAAKDVRIRVLRRVGRRGLSGACVEGMLAASAPIVAVMDADLQHDETLLPRMFDKISNGADLAVGTRYSDGGQSDAGFSAYRQRISQFATGLARTVLHVTISDPMSGFFMVRRQIVEDAAPRLSSQGFKILLDLVATSPSGLKIAELPFTFRERHAGASKLDSLVALDYLGLLASKSIGDWFSVRFAMFALVGASGLGVHLIGLLVLLGGLHLPFGTAQTLATYLSMIWNFFANNRLTYRDQRLTGFAALRGLIVFCAVCSVGAFANVGVASWIYGGRPSWWLAGTAGALMGAVFNYAASSALTWRRA